MPGVGRAVEGYFPQKKALVAAPAREKRQLDESPVTTIWKSTLTPTSKLAVSLDPTVIDVIRRNQPTSKLPIKEAIIISMRVLWAFSARQISLMWSR